MYRLSAIAAIVNGRLSGSGADVPVTQLVYDSRRISQPASSLFFALRTKQKDGHVFLQDAYQKGVRCFVTAGPPHNLPGDAAFIEVPDPLAALQALARYHRAQFRIPVIGITGSNGKTVVKEWLYQLLSPEKRVVRSPRSYNSQIGVPLSVWQMKPEDEIGIFEAGISTTSEMDRLQQVIQPTVGLLTNLGEAHSEGFASPGEKLREKAVLFRNVEVLIGRQELLEQLASDRPLFSWSRAAGADVQLLQVEKDGASSVLTIAFREGQHRITIPFTDEASVENALQCLCVLLYLQYDPARFAARFAGLHPVDMRLQLEQGINGCLVLNDSYSADITSLRIALQFLQQQSAGLKRTVILSDFVETGRPEESLYPEIAVLLKEAGVRKVVAVGEGIGRVLPPLLPDAEWQVYPDTDSLVHGFKTSAFTHEAVLVKGARQFAFERVARLFEKRLHGTELQISLDALAHNLRQYRQLLRPSTRVMAMVKAFSYGSGGVEIASVLQFHNVHYLGVAYADEGVELVKGGIRLPILVLNAEDSSFQAIVDHQLQPVIYSFALLHAFETYLRGLGLEQYPVHVELETGMNRLGFAEGEVAALAEHLSRSPWLRLQTVFTHLVASEDPAQDAFTHLQAERFARGAALLQERLDYPFLRHIANSAAIVRLPALQLDMVRLGIGLYGIEVDGEQRLDLQAVATLRSTIAQLKTVKAGESVSYNRRGIVQRDSLIATVRIGYADGYSRQFSNGRGQVRVRGRLAPVVGTVCMDMTMVDVTGIAGVQEGDEVIIFGPELPVQDVAARINTIPYEVMTGISQRVKRVYFHE